MCVIGHHAPGEEFVAVPMKVPDGVSYNFGNSKVAHEAFAQTSVKAALGPPQDSAQLVEAGAVCRAICARVLCPFDCLALGAKLPKHVLGERIR